jgi:signal transduction histidine kinase/ligand-binding sensor domain-containing protein
LAEDGLPSNRVYKAVEGKHGFVWLATSRGLCQYDGHKFRVFKHHPKDSTTISNDNIRTVSVDSKGNIWAGTLMHGLNKYDFSTSKFTRYLHHENDPYSLVNNMVLCVFEDSKGRIWVGTEYGLSILNPDTGKFDSYVNKPDDSSSLGHGGVISIAEDAERRIWITTWDGGLNLAIPSKDGGYIFQKFFPNDIKHYWSLFLDSQNRFWVGTFDGGLLLMKTDTNRATGNLKFSFLQFKHIDNSSLGPGSDIIFDINEDKQGRLWLGTALGLNAFDAKQFRPSTMSLAAMEAEKKRCFFKLFHYEYGEVNSIPNNVINGLGVNKDGVMWACSNGGLVAFDPKSHPFKPIYLDNNPHAAVVTFSSVAEAPDGKLWFATDDSGMFVMDTTDYSFLRMDKVFPKRICDLVGKYVFTLYMHDGRFLYVGSQGGFFRLDMRRKTCETLISAQDFRDKYGGVQFESKSIYEDKKGDLWIGTTYGLFRIAQSTRKIEHWLTSSAGNAKLTHNIINGIVEDDDGVLWVCSYQGLDKVNMSPSGEVLSFTNFNYDGNDTYSLSSNRTTSICKKNGILYIGTETGISKMIGEGKFVTIGNNEIPVDYYVKAIIPGEGNELWGTTNAGIFRYDIAADKFRFFDKIDGIHDEEFRIGAAFRTGGGAIIFCGRMGATLFTPGGVEPNLMPERVHLTNFLVQNLPLNNGLDPVLIKNIVLDSKQNNLSFEFSSLNFMRPKLSSYYYKLEGFDKDWILVGDQGMANYSNLPGGDYVFKVRGTNSHGTWEELPSLVVPVQIALPFWQTGWFYIICFIVAYLVFLGGVHIRTMAIQRKNKLLKTYNDDLNREVVERKKIEESLRKTNEELSRSNYDLEQFAYIASHDLQEPLRMVGNFVQLLNRRYGDKVDDHGREYIGFAVEGVTRMSELIQSLLKYSRVGRNDMEFVQASSAKIISDTCKKLTQLMADRKVELVVEGHICPILCEPEQLGMVFQNLFINAIKFNKSEAPRLVVKCEELEQAWLFSIKDNGIGIDQRFQDKIFEIFKRLHSRTEFEGHGIGLALCKRIVTRHGGKIWFESQFGEGTTFFFTISKKSGSLADALNEAITNIGPGTTADQRAEALGYP